MDNYLEAFENIIEDQKKRLALMDKEEPIDFSKISPVIVAYAPGDGIGPIIMDETIRVLGELLKEEISQGRIEFREIEGLTIENRLEKGETIPADVLAKIKECNLLLKGPTETPDNKSAGQNLESANVALRRELDLYANVRPVIIPDLGIDWTFFRENTEGEYVLGSKGIDLPGMAVDFKVITDLGSKRIARAAFEYAKNNGNKKVSIVTKANIIKKTDGKFLEIGYQVAKEYPEVPVDDWYVDIMAANLINPSRQSSYEVILMPNLYGDILTDEAAQLQGGVGTAGSANIGSNYAMFEAIHGSAPRMVEMGRAHLANPASLIKAAELMLRHIGMLSKANLLGKGLLNASLYFESKLTSGGKVSTKEYGDAVIRGFSD